MRVISLLSLGLALFSGCQVASQVTARNEPSPATLRLPPAAAATPAPSPVQRAQFQGEIPKPASEPETLPQAALRPATDGALTLSDLEQMAMSANPSVARAAALVQAASGNYTQVGLPPNPTVGYSGQQIGSRGLAEQDGVFINQEIIAQSLGINWPAELHIRQSSFKIMKKTLLMLLGFAAVFALGTACFTPSSQPDPGPPASA